MYTGLFAAMGKQIICYGKTAYLLLLGCDYFVTTDYFSLCVHFCVPIIYFYLFVYTYFCFLCTDYGYFYVNYFHLFVYTRLISFVPTMAISLCSYYLCLLYTYSGSLCTLIPVLCVPIIYLCKLIFVSCVPTMAICLWTSSISLCTLISVLLYLLWLFLCVPIIYAYCTLIPVLCVH